MRDVSVMRALALMGQTWPFLLLRAAVYLGITLALAVAVGTGAGFGYGIGAFGSDAFQARAAFWGGAISFAAVAAVVYLFRGPLLHLVTAGHIAAMVAAIGGQGLPGGRGQVDLAMTAVRDRFGEAPALLALHRMSQEVVRAVTGLVVGSGDAPDRSGGGVLGTARRVFLRVAAGLVDEMVIAQAFRSGSDNPWTTARAGLVLHAQNAAPLLRAAAGLTLAGWVLALLLFPVMLVPAAAMAGLFPGEPTGAGLVFALVFVWAAGSILVAPFQMACMLQVFLRLTDGQVPRQDWTARLTEVSEPFRHMGEQAEVWMPSGLRIAPRR